MARPLAGTAPGAVPRDPPAKVEARDPAVFAHLDFAAFSDYVCDRFLADRPDPTHRYALRVLLHVPVPGPAETGVGSRERVLHWFRGRGDLGYFTRRLGVGRPARPHVRRSSRR